MTRPLVAVDARDPGAVLVALRVALSASGPAILPAIEKPAGLPASLPKRVALVIQTSGSSGEPKRVALSADAVLASAGASSAALGGPGQWLLALPAQYIAGVNVLVRSIAAQTEPVLLPPGHFDARAFTTAAATMDGELRFTSVVPAQLARLVDAAADRGVLATLRGFERILVGGQAVPPDLLARADAIGLRVTRTYGSSETAGGCVYDGVPIGTAEVRVTGGEVEISGPMLAEGYLGDPERTARTFVMSDRARWYRTGDTGTITDGVLSVTGRRDRVIISGGIKVSLDEVERIARRQPGLADAVAVPRDSAEWGEVPVIVSTGAADLAALRAAVTSELGRPAAPEETIRVGGIPLLESGKPDLVALRALVRTH